MIKFGSARIDENGRARGGQRGDQTGREVMEQPAYWHKNGWIGLRPKDPNKANIIAWCMKVCCLSNIVGYNQDYPERYMIFLTGLEALTNADCSTLAPFCVYQSGIQNFEIEGIWTGNMVERLLGTGQFERFEVNDLNALCTGDVLVDGKQSSHTVIVTEGNTRGWDDAFDVPRPTLSYRDQGEEVRKLQRFFNEYGDGCTVDGDFGFETWAKVYTFQQIFGLTADGIYGQDTYGLLCFFLWGKGVKTK